MSGINPVRGPEGDMPHEHVENLSDIDAMKLLGDLKASVHRTAVYMENFEPRFTAGQVFTNALIGGVALSMLMPGAAPAILVAAAGLGVAGALLEAGATLGINVTGSVIARWTEPPPPPPQNPPRQ